MGEKSRAVLDAADIWLAALNEMELLGETPSLQEKLAEAETKARVRSQSVAPRRRQGQRLRLSEWRPAGPVPATPERSSGRPSRVPARQDRAKAALGMIFSTAALAIGWAEAFWRV